MEVYLDNSATTRPYDEAVAEMMRVMTECYGNPSSLHSLGKKAEDEVNGARDIIASTLGVSSKEIIFTSGGTESDNLAIMGTAMSLRRRGNRIITQKTEHMAVLETFRHLEESGFEVYYAGVDSDGTIDADDVIAHIDDKTILVSIMHVNNETGAIMPVDKIGRAIDHSRCLFHIDAVQSYGKIPFNPKALGADLVSISSHKIHGPKGIGALYIRDGVRILPVVYGGKQENGLRSGTENVPAICGFAEAARVRFSRMEDSTRHISYMKERLLYGLNSRIENVVVNSPQNSIYSILNVSFPGLKSEVLLHILETKGIYVSTGSACNSKKKLSYVLKEMGIKDNVIDGAIRISLCEFVTEEEIDYVVEVLSKEVPLLRKIMR